MYSKDAIYYDLLNDGLIDGDLEFYHSHLPRQVESICELACGTGRILYSLAAPERKLTGIDVTSEMLEVAQSKQKELGIEVRLIHDDMCNLGKYGETYDVIICGYNAVQHIFEIKKLRKFLEAIRNSLTPRGIAFIDLFNPNNRFLYPEGHERELKTITLQDGKPIRIVEYTKYYKEKEINELWYSYFNGDQLLFAEHYQMKQYYPAALDHMITSCGLQIINKYGSYQGEAFSADSLQQIYMLEAISKAHTMNSTNKKHALGSV